MSDHVVARKPKLLFPERGGSHSVGCLHLLSLSWKETCGKEEGLGAGGHRAGSASWQAAQTSFFLLEIMTYSKVSENYIVHTQTFLTALLRSDSQLAHFKGTVHIYSQLCDLHLIQV